MRRFLFLVSIFLVTFSIAGCIVKTSYMFYLGVMDLSINNYSSNSIAVEVVTLALNHNNSNMFVVDRGEFSVSPKKDIWVDIDIGTTEISETSHSWPSGIVKLWDEEEWENNWKNSLFGDIPYKPLTSLRKLLNEKGISDVSIGTYIKIRKGTKEIVLSGFPNTIADFGLGSYGFLWYEGKYDGFDRIVNFVGIFPKEDNLTTNLVKPLGSSNSSTGSMNSIESVSLTIDVGNTNVNAEISYSIIDTNMNKLYYFTNFYMPF
ncbi:MAG: hypothetical protein ACP5QP_04590 [Brevinematia bacterium]